jgi:hypothetical protein
MEWWKEYQNNLKRRGWHNTWNSRRAKIERYLIWIFVCLFFFFEKEFQISNFLFTLLLVVCRSIAYHDYACVYSHCSDSRKNIKISFWLEFQWKLDLDLKPPNHDLLTWIRLYSKISKFSIFTSFWTDEKRDIEQVNLFVVYSMKLLDKL